MQITIKLWKSAVTIQHIFNVWFLPKNYFFHILINDYLSLIHLQSYLKGSYSKHFCSGMSSTPLRVVFRDGNSFVYSFIHHNFVFRACQWKFNDDDLLDGTIEKRPRFHKHLPLDVQVPNLNSFFLWIWRFFYLPSPELSFKERRWI